MLVREKSKTILKFSQENFQQEFSKLPRCTKYISISINSILVDANMRERWGIKHGQIER